MRRNMAQTITKQEWEKIMQLPEVQATFDIRVLDDLNDFAGRIYGAKFNFEMIMPEEEEIIYTLVGEISKGEVLVLNQVNDVLRAMK